MRIAVFASGTGSNFQSIVDAIKIRSLDASVELLVCDKPNALVIERAKREEIDMFSFNPKEFSSKAEYENEIVKVLQKKNIQFLILAGYMRLIGPTLLEKYVSKIINIHPSLLPLFPGKDAIGQALEAGAKTTGVTIHYVDEGMDTGPIIAQEAIAIQEDDTALTLADRIHEIEHRLYPQTLQTLFAASLTKNGGDRHHEESTN